MKKVGYIIKELARMVKKHKLRIIAPILIILALLAFLIYYVAPYVSIAFIYAGI